MVTVAIVNLRSGGRNCAEYSLRRLRAEYGENHVFAIVSGKPNDYRKGVSEFFSTLAPDVIVVAGGDGTMSFAMDVIKEIQEAGGLGRGKGRLVPFPLGTGNDLSCTLGYGTGFARWAFFGEFRFQRMMKRYASAKHSHLDRWALSYSALDPTSGRWTVVEQKTMNNYFSIGLDAAVANRLNAFRQKHPHLFFTRPAIKLWYAFFGVLSAVLQPEFGDTTTVTIDGKVMKLPPNAKVIVVTNVLTYAGGSLLWNPTGETTTAVHRPQSISDGVVEVSYLTGVVHLSLVRLNWAYGTNVGQGREVVIECNPQNHFQYDGEPLDAPAKQRGRARFRVTAYAKADVLQSTLEKPSIWMDMFFSLLYLALFIVPVVIAYSLWPSQ